MPKLNIAVIGASGAIGSAFIEQLNERIDTNTIFALSRSECVMPSSKITPLTIDLESEESIQSAADAASSDAPLDLVIVATGFLHDGSIMPEKSLKDLTAKKFEKLFAINSIGPALVAKHFLPKLTCQRRSVFAAVSARVGSISDNSLGGWYAYRASKAALNMIIKCASIEMARRNPKAIVIALHPGTVDSSLSRPFHRHVPENQLFSPSQAAEKLLSVIDCLESNDSGTFIAWDRKPIPYEGHKNRFNVQLEENWLSKDDQAIGGLLQTRSDFSILVTWIFSGYLSLKNIGCFASINERSQKFNCIACCGIIVNVKKMVATINSE